MNNKQLKTKTYVDNPSIKDTITKTTFHMRFSKSNFMFIGKWIIAFVLVVVLGSQALNGFISSKFTKDSTTETIVHEYKKEVGTELVGGNFNFINSIDDFSLLIDKKIYFKNADEIDFSILSLNQNTDYVFKLLGSRNFYLSYYDFNDSLLSSHYYRYVEFIHVFDYYYYILTNQSSNYLFYNENSNTYRYYGTASNYSYFKITRYIDDTTFSFDIVNNSIDDIVSILNTFFIYGESIERPIYETITYTYEVKDNNYNWDLKLKQLSAFKPLFKFNQSFINEDYLKYNNLISYEYIDTSAGRELLVERYKNDERLKPLFDNNNLIIGGKTESGLFKDKTKYYSFLKFNGDLDFDNGDISSAYNWVLDNYVTDFNIDSYLTESKYKIELKDILEIFKFPIQIVNNLVYDFGVLIGFITWW